MSAALHRITYDKTSPIHLLLPERWFVVYPVLVCLVLVYLVLVYLGVVYLVLVLEEMHCQRLLQNLFKCQHLNGCMHIR